MDFDSDLLFQFNKNKSTRCYKIKMKEKGDVEHHKTEVMKKNKTKRLHYLCEAEEFRNQRV